MWKSKAKTSNDKECPWCGEQPSYSIRKDDNSFDTSYRQGMVPLIEWYLGSVRCNNGDCPFYINMRRDELCSQSEEELRQKLSTLWNTRKGDGNEQR